jgi:hypothetical protein
MPPDAALSLPLRSDYLAVIFLLLESILTVKGGFRSVLLLSKARLSLPLMSSLSLLLLLLLSSTSACFCVLGKGLLLLLLGSDETLLFLFRGGEAGTRVGGEAGTRVGGEAGVGVVVIMRSEGGGGGSRVEEE